MTTDPSFSVGLVQTSCCPDTGQNRRVAFAAAREAATRGAQIICLPELFSSEYLCQHEDESRFDLAESIPGPSTEEAARLARELGVVLVVPVFERRAPGLYHNSAVVVDADGSQVGLYRKMHIPDDPQYYEKYYFTPGDLGYQAFETRFGKVGVLICWDQWYPEAARLTALRGADVIFYPTAIGWIGSDQGPIRAAQLDAWQTVQRGHAIANGVYVAAVNRVGREDGPGEGIDFWGHSFACDPQGRVMGEASGSEPDVLVVTCDRRAIEEQRRAWPFLRDRRVDSYGELRERYLDGSRAEPRVDR